MFVSLPRGMTGDGHCDQGGYRIRLGTRGLHLLMVLDPMHGGVPVSADASPETGFCLQGSFKRPVGLPQASVEKLCQPDEVHTWLGHRVASPLRLLVLGLDPELSPNLASDLVRLSCGRLCCGAKRK